MRDEREDRAQGACGVEVVVHCLDELLLGLARDVRKLGGVDVIGVCRVVGCPDEVAVRRADAFVGRARIGEALIGEVERRAVVGLQHEQAQRHGVATVEHVGEQQEVAQALRHLLRVDVEHAAVHPVMGERGAIGRLGLRHLVFVVREDEVGAAAVDVERQAEVLLGHCGAFEVPTGASLAPRRGPMRLAGLCRLPQREVERVFFSIVNVDARAAAQVVDVAA